MHGNPEEDNCQNTFLRLYTYLSVFITFVSQDFIPIFDYKKDVIPILTRCYS